MKIIEKDYLILTLQDIYCIRFDIKYLKNCLQYENYFIIAGINNLYQFLFAIISLKNWALFYEQQKQQKLISNIKIFITYKKFKVFFSKKLGESGVLIDNIWRKI